MKNTTRLILMGFIPIAMLVGFSLLRMLAVSELSTMPIRTET